MAPAASRALRVTPALPLASAASPPLVTIVSPSLNQGAYVAQAIESVLGQDYGRIEYVVMDGGSTDETIPTLRRYGDRLRWISERDSGQAAAINRGVAMGSGEIVAWLNCDDYYEPGAVSRAVRHFLDRPDLMLVYGDARFVDAGGRDLGPCDQVEPFDFDRLLHHGDIIAQPAAFFRREAFTGVGGLDESLHWTLDYDLWLKIGRRFPVRHIPECLACYRLTGENKTARGGAARFDEVAAVARRHGAPGLPAAFRIEQLAGAWRAAPRLLREGRAGEAVAQVASSFGAVIASRRARAELVMRASRRLRARGRSSRGSERAS